MDRVRVLIFVDEHVAEAILILLQHVGIFAEQPQAFEQQIAEIGGVQNFQPLLIEPVELCALAIGESSSLARRHMCGIEAAILPGIDLIGECARWPALVVDVLRLQNLLQQADLIVRIDDRERGLEADKLGMAAQNLGRDRVERAEPGHAFGDDAGEDADPLLHLPRRLVGEGDGEDLARVGAAGRENMGDPRRQNPRLAGAGPGEHEKRAIDRLDRRALLWIEPVEIAQRRRPTRPRRDAARAQARRLETEALLLETPQGIVQTQGSPGENERRINMANVGSLRPSVDPSKPPHPGTATFRRYTEADPLCAGFDFGGIAMERGSRKG